MNNEKTIRQLRRVIDKILFMNKKNMIEFQGVRLYPSEIHVLLVIGEGHGTNATQMANHLGVTKGAVSQAVSRLEKKGVLYKHKDPYNKNELTLTLTALGAEALECCRRDSMDFFRKHDEYLSNLNEPEREAIRQFLQHLETTIDGME